MKISTFGTLLVVTGTIFLLQNTGTYPSAVFDLWPTLLIAIGATDIVNALD